MPLILLSVKAARGKPNLALLDCKGQDTFICLLQFKSQGRVNDEPTPKTGFISAQKKQQKKKDKYRQTSSMLAQY